MQYDQICEKEWKASELNTKMKQQYLLEKKQYCEAKLLEKRLARQAALAMDEEYASLMSEGVSEGVSEGGEEEEEESEGVKEGVKEEESEGVVSEVQSEEVDDSLHSVTNVLQGITVDTVANSSVFKCDSSVPQVKSGECGVSEHNDGDGDSDGDDESECASEEHTTDENNSDRSSGVSAKRTLTNREVKLFVKDYFNNTFPDRVVSHVTTHEGVHIYKNKLLMQKVKRRAVSNEEVEKNEALLAQLPYLTDIKSYKFYFVQ